MEFLPLGFHCRWGLESSFLQWFFSFLTLFCQEEGSISHTCKGTVELLPILNYIIQSEILEILVLKCQ